MGIIKSENISILISAGLRPHEAKTLIYLFEYKKARSKDIERTMDFRQPEVCVALSMFKTRGWIKKESEKRCITGRPNVNYILVKKPKDIISSLEKNMQNNIDKYIKIKKQLEDVGK
jgi:predicted transcriptional regulator